MRKTKLVKISAPGRDLGKTYALTEMPAEQAEKWGYRALTALGRSGATIPAALEGTGMLGMARMGLIALVCCDYKDANALLDEMMQCVRIYGTPGDNATLRDLIAGTGAEGEEADIEEVETLLHLRLEVLKLHVDFSQAADLWIRISAAIRAVTETIQMYQTSSDA